MRPGRPANGAPLLGPPEERDCVSVRVPRVLLSAGPLVQLPRLQTLVRRRGLGLARTLSVEGHVQALVVLGQFERRRQTYRRQERSIHELLAQQEVLDQECRPVPRDQYVLDQSPNAATLLQ